MPIDTLSHIILPNAQNAVKLGTRIEAQQHAWQRRISDRQGLSEHLSPEAQ